MNKRAGVSSRPVRRTPRPTCSTTAPFSMTAISSADWIVDKRCATITVVRPWRALKLRGDWDYCGSTTSTAKNLLLQSIMHQLLALGIQSSRGLVQQQQFNLVLAEQCTSDRDALTLERYGAGRGKRSKLKEWLFIPTIQNTQTEPGHQRAVRLSRRPACRSPCQRQR